MGVQLTGIEDRDTVEVVWRMEIYSSIVDCGDIITAVYCTDSENFRRERVREKINKEG